MRVSIYQSSKPQQICPPDYFSKFEDNLDNSLSNYNCNLDDIMTTASPIPGYDRQQRYVSQFCLPLEIVNLMSILVYFVHSTDSGWDNPFRPGGDLSREADEIVKMISGKYKFKFLVAQKMCWCFPSCFFSIRLVNIA